MRAKDPDVTFFCHCRLLKLGIHIEVIFLDILIMNTVHELLYLRRIKSGKGCIKICFLQFHNQICEEFLIPFTGDLIKRYV